MTDQFLLVGETGKQENHRLTQSHWNVLRWLIFDKLMQQSAMDFGILFIIIFPTYLGQVMAVLSRCY